MWKLLLIQLKIRANNVKVWIPTISAIVWLASMYAMGGRLNPGNLPLFVVALHFLILGVLFGTSAYYWFYEPLDTTQRTCCVHCNFDLQGHENIPEFCPECGNEPTPLTDPYQQSVALVLSLIPGFVLMFASLCNVLLTVLYLI